VIVSAQRIRSRVDDSEDVANSVQKSLVGSAYCVLRTLSLCYERGVLFLRGQLPTYFHRQLAQEAVRRIEGVTRIINQIEVTGEPFRHGPLGRRQLQPVTLNQPRRLQNDFYNHRHP